MIWFRKRYSEVNGVAIPDPLIGNENDVPGIPEGTCLAQYLVPFEQDRGFDSAFNLLSFDPPYVLTGLKRIFLNMAPIS